MLLSGTRHGVGIGEDDMEILVHADGTTKRLRAKKNENLMTVLLRNGLDLAHPCRGKGKCGKCKVRVSDWDAVSDPSQTGAGNKGTGQLACLVKVDRDLSVVAKANWKQEAKRKREKPAVRQTTPPFIRTCVAIADSGEKQGGSLWGQLLDSFEKEDRKVLKRSMEQVLPLLPALFEAPDKRVTLIRSETRFLGLVPGDAAEQGYGAAVMVTEKALSGMLISLSGEETAAFLRAPMVEMETQPALRALLQGLCSASGVPVGAVANIVLSGNVNALHRMTGLNGVSVGARKGVPVFLEERSMMASSIGLSLETHAGVWIPPMLSGEIGTAPVLQDLAPYWVPVVTQCMALAGESLTSPAREDEARQLSGLLGCLCHQERRKELRKRVKQVRKEIGK